MPVPCLVNSAAAGDIARQCDVVAVGVEGAGPVEHDRIVEAECRRRLQGAAVEGERAARAQAAGAAHCQRALRDRPRRRLAGRAGQGPGAGAGLLELPEVAEPCRRSDQADVEARVGAAAQPQGVGGAEGHHVAGDRRAGPQLEDVGAAGEGDGVGGRAARTAGDRAAVDDRRAGHADAGTAVTTRPAGTSGDRAGGRVGDRQARAADAGAAVAARDAGAAGAARDRTAVGDRRARTADAGTAGAAMVFGGQASDTAGDRGADYCC